MAIAQGTFADLQFDGGSTTQTRSINNVAGTVLYVWVATNNPGTCSGVTWNGVAMTEIDTEPEPGARTYYLFCLVNADLGTHDLVVTSTDTAGIYSGFSSYTGADLTTQPDVFTSTFASNSSNLSTSLTSSDDDAWAVCIGRSDFFGLDGQTNLTGLGAFSSIRMFDSAGSLGVAGSKTLAFVQNPTTPTAGNRLCGIFAIIKPAAASAPSKLAILGVG